MVEMTDYEINRRLAEIAGVKAWDRRLFGVLRMYIDVDPENSDEVEEWSPLTNWSQLGPLMERERIEITKDGHEYWGAWLNDHEPAAVEKDLKRAICLAIIAAHEDGL